MASNSWIGFLCIIFVVMDRLNLIMVDNKMCQCVCVCTTVENIVRYIGGFQASGLLKGE